MEQPSPDREQLDRKKTHKLGKRLAFFIIIASSMITIITTAVQLKFDYSQSIELVDQRFIEIEDAHVGAIAGSLWGFDYKLSQIQLNGIASVSEIEYAELGTTDNDLTLTAGIKKSKNFIATEIPIFKEKKNREKQLLAKLYLYASKDEIYDRLIDKTIVILLSNAVKTFIIAGFILLLFQYLVTRHLNNLAQFARNIDIGNTKSLEKSFRLERRSKDTEDELDDVVHALEEMRSKLLASLKKIQTDTKELERSNQDLDRFANIASHDLKEPVRKILLFSDKLLENNPDLEEPTQKKYLEKINKSSLKIYNLIENILLYSRLGEHKDGFEQVNLNNVVAGTIQNIESLIEESGGRIESSNLPEIDAIQAQMTQLFQNLIVNALKYRRDEIAPVIKVTGKEQKNGFVVIKVEDNGIGLDEEYCDLIFQPFERLNNTTTLDGSGMGLAICYKIVVSHGGFLEVESELGKGSIFIITLPKTQKD